MVDIFTPAERSRIMALVRSKDTAPERVVRTLVHRMGFRFRLHKRSLPGSPDLVFAGRKRVIFVHGCFWHCHTCAAFRVPSTNRAFWKRKLTGNAERDRRSIGRLRRAGWRVMVIWECQTSPRRLDRLAGRIARFFSE
jgi:DNA mismatch endonuclease (patch repair protein)